MVIWTHHVIFCFGEDFDMTFGLMHMADKSMVILGKVRAMQPYKRQTIEPYGFPVAGKGL